MSDIYTNLQGVANNLLPPFKQGTIVLRRFTRAAPDSPSQVGAVTATKDWVLAAVMPKEIPKKFINGTSIVEGDLMVVSAVRALSPVENINPQMDDVVLVDGAQKTIKAIKPVPIIGPPIVFQIFIQG